MLRQHIVHTKRSRQRAWLSISTNLHYNIVDTDMITITLSADNNIGLGNSTIHPRTYIRIYIYIYIL